MFSQTQTRLHTHTHTSSGHKSTAAFPVCVHSSSCLACCEWSPPNHTLTYREDAPASPSVCCGKFARCGVGTERPHPHPSDHAKPLEPPSFPPPAPRMLECVYNSPARNIISGSLCAWPQKGRVREQEIAFA